jgi:hypothetical protein
MKRENDSHWTGRMTSLSIYMNRENEGHSLYTLIARSGTIYIYKDMEADIHGLKSRIGKLKFTIYLDGEFEDCFL